MSSGFFQLGILLHQLLQPEPRELYRNLGVFPISFSLVDSALAVFRVADFLPRAEALLAFGFLDDCLRHIEFLAARGEELGDIVDRVVALAGVGRLGAFRTLALPGQRSGLRPRRSSARTCGRRWGRDAADRTLPSDSRPVGSCPSTDGAASLLILRPDLRAPPPETARAHWLRAGRSRTAGGRLPGSGPAYPWRASCPHSTAAALPRCRPSQAACASAGKVLLQARTGTPAETPDPWRRAAS